MEHDPPLGSWWKNSPFKLLLYFVSLEGSFVGKGRARCSITKSWNNYVMFSYSRMMALSNLPLSDLSSSRRHGYLPGSELTRMGCSLREKKKTKKNLFSPNEHSALKVPVHFNSAAVGPAPRPVYTCQTRVLFVCLSSPIYEIVL